MLKSKLINQLFYLTVSPMTTKEIVILLCIMFFALFVRLWRLDYPSVAYFDEQYHVPAILAMSRDQWALPFNYQNQTVATWDWLHPPLAKYWQALSVKLLGEVPAAWRLPSALFGVILLIVYYFFVRFVAWQFLWPTKPQQAINLALGSTFLLSLSGLLLVQSRIAMNDVLSSFFILSASFAFVVFLRFPKKLWLLLLTGAILGLAIAAKWTGLWFMLLFVLWSCCALPSWRALPFRIFSLLILPVAIYVGSYYPLLNQSNGLSKFYLLQQVILSSHLQNPSTHSDSSSPLSWPFGGKSVWYFTDQVANIYLFENYLLLFYGFVSLVALLCLIYRNKITALRQPIVYFLLFCYLVSFLPFIFFSRIMFLYHYLPALPFLLLWPVYVLQVMLDGKRYGVWFNFYFWPAWFFVLAYPLWTALRLYF